MSPLVIAGAGGGLYSPPSSPAGPAYQSSAGPSCDEPPGDGGGVMIYCWDSEDQRRPDQHRQHGSKVSIERE